MPRTYSRRSLFRFLLYSTVIFGLLKKPLDRLLASTVNNAPGEFPDARLQEILDGVIINDKVPGVVMYISTPGGVWTGASGVRSVETGEKIEPTDAFSIASTSKTFVAVVILQLVDRDKLTLDRSITDYLPEDITSAIPYSDQITVRQLLDHTSGVAEYLSTPEFIKATENRGRSRPWKAREAIEFIFHKEAQGPPGKTFAYTDTNYILLQLIAEGLTGKSLAQVTRSGIFNPCGLDHSYTELWESPREKVATGYKIDSQGKLHSQAAINEGNGLGDGALMSTGEDLNNFLRCLLVRKSLLSPSALKEMLTFPIEKADREAPVNEYLFMGVKGYGLGIEKINTPWGAAFGHTGNAYGFVSAMLYLPGQNTIIVVLVNGDGVDGVDIAFDGLKLLLDRS